MAEGLARSGFDLDLRFGQSREATLAEVLQMRGGNHLELKSDQRARVTGKVFVEFKQHGRPSGIAVTQSEWWTVEVEKDVFVTLPTAKMRALARRAYKEFGPLQGGDGDAYEGVLVPVEWLTQPWRSS